MKESFRLTNGNRKNCFFAIFDLHLSIVKTDFDCHLSGVLEPNNNFEREIVNILLSISEYYLIHQL